MLGVSVAYCRFRQLLSRSPQPFSPAALQSLKDYLLSTIRNWQLAPVFRSTAKTPCLQVRPGGITVPEPNASLAATCPASNPFGYPAPDLAPFPVAGTFNASNPLLAL
jgi:hypothetical protein